MIRIENISKAFDDKEVLNDISFSINSGQRLCIIGQSGSGKSVLLKLIIGMLEPDKGDIFFNDKSVVNSTKKEMFALRNKVGFVFQSAALFDSYNVFDNVILSLYDAGERDQQVLEDEACRVLSGVSLLPPISEKGSVEYQKEWEQLKDKMPSDLSGGMRKRVGVARALVGNPEYIFYDEPTTGLDPITSEQIDDLILSLDKAMNVTSIIITHDIFSVYRVAEQVIMLYDGKKHFEGNVQQLRNSNDEIVKSFIDRFECTSTS